MTASRCRRRHAIRFAALASLTTVIAACGTPPDAGSNAAPPDPAAVAAQACSERVHDLSEQLLLYHAHHGLLPADVTEAHQDGEFKATCPGTNTLYLYNPAGWPTDREGEFVVLCDATPVHLGRRLGLVIQPAEPGAPLVLRVTALEASFTPQ